jgi:AbrB family looped-hinge helix DNA binding protein
MMGDMHRRMTSRGRVTIPIELRRRLGIKPGMKLIVREVDGQIVVMTMEGYVRSLRGILKGKGLMKDLMKDRLSERLKEMRPS